MPRWFDEWLYGFKEDARAYADLKEDFTRLAAEFLRISTEFQQQQRPEPFTGAILHTSSGRSFIVGLYRQIEPGEFHYCQGNIHIAPTRQQFFPGTWQHVCWVLHEIPREPPPPPPRPQRSPADALRRHLRTLGFKKTETPAPAEVRARYLDLAKRYHPDVNPRGADRMKRITEAYRSYQELTQCNTTTGSG